MKFWPIPNTTVHVYAYTLSTRGAVRSVPGQAFIKRNCSVAEWLAVL